MHAFHRSRLTTTLAVVIGVTGLITATATTASASPTIPDVAAPHAGSIDTCAQAAYQAGFRGQSLVNAIAIGMAESGCDPTNDGYSDGHTYYGLWQISDIHPEGNPTCGHDPDCNADAAWKYSYQGTNWCAWQTWSGAGCSGGGYDDRYAQFLSQAQQAADGVSSPPPPSVGSGVFGNGGIDDVSGDGHADLLFVNGSTVQYLPDNSGTNPNHVPFSGNSSPVVQGLPAGALVAAGSITGHATADLFVYDPGTDSVKLYQGAGGTNPYAGTGYTVATDLGHNVTKIFAADVTGDGYADLIYTKSDGTAWLLQNNIGKTPDHLPFTGEAAQRIVTDLPAGAVVTVGDLNNDHYADMLYTSGGNLFVLWNNILKAGSGGLPYTNDVGVQLNSINGSFAGITQMTAADLSGDGYADLLWTDSTGEVNYLANNYNYNPDHQYFYGSSTPSAALGAGHALI